MVMVSSLLSYFFKERRLYNFFEESLNNLFLFAFSRSTYFYMNVFALNTLFYKSSFAELSSFERSDGLDLLKYCIYLSSLDFYVLLFTPGREHYSMSHLFLNLSWSEREIGEMHGINFFNKRDSRNLLLDYSFIGNPMRKNYPSIGFSELAYFPLSGLVSYIAFEGHGSFKVDYCFN